MSNFWNMSTGKTFADYFLSKNYYATLLVCLVLIIFLTMFISRKSFKTQKIFLIIATTLLVAFEGLRIFWRYNFLVANNLEITFFNLTNLDITTLAIWITVPILLFNIFARKEYEGKSFLMHFIFSVANLLCIISLIYPLNINTNGAFYEFYNLVYGLERSIVISVAFISMIANWIDVEEYNSLGHALLSTIILAVLCVGIKYISGVPENIFFTNQFLPFEEMGVFLSPPWHFILMWVFAFLLETMVLYLPSRLIKKARKN